MGTPSYNDQVPVDLLYALVLQYVTSRLCKFNLLPCTPEAVADITKLAAFVYLVAERRRHGNTMQDLREDIEHRENQRVTALSLSELIVKEGDQNWSDDLLEGLGPWLMVQLADLANFFESMRK